MSITAWSCPGCKKIVPLTHFNETQCGLVVHPDYAEAVLHGNDDYYGLDKVTVTSALGCPRSRAIEEQCDVAVNPLDYNALLIGTAWDVHLASYAPEGDRKIQVQGIINGIMVHGEIDRLRKVQGYLTIEDHKHGNNFQYKYAKEAKPEHILQLSLYAELYSQVRGVRPTHGTIWNHYSGANKKDAPPLRPFTFLLWALEDCLAYKPYNGEYTVAQLFKQVALYQAGKTDQGVRLSALELPLVGETMSFGSASYCDYCQVRSVCFTAAKGAPF